MIRQRINNIEKQTNKIKQMNKKHIFILHYVNDNVFEYNKMRYNTLDNLKRENSITENDSVMITSIEYV